MNIIDLRDIVDKQETEPDTYEAWKTALWEDAGYAIDDVAENEPTMIPEYDFAEYAQELAEDIGAIDRDAKWPVYCIELGAGSTGAQNGLCKCQGQRHNVLFSCFLIVYSSHSDRPRGANYQRKHLERRHGKLKL